MYKIGSWLRGNQEQVGAIDVVAIRRSDGSICCSPFHARFNKLARKGERNIVKLLVNGNPTNILLKLGAMGEVFFVEKTRERVKRHFRTSPCASPEQDVRDRPIYESKDGDHGNSEDVKRDDDTGDHTQVKYPIAIRAPDVVENENPSFPQRLRSLSDGDMGSCSGEESPMIKSRDHSEEYTKASPVRSVVPSIENTTMKNVGRIQRERSYSEGVDANSANDNNFMPITTNSSQMSVESPSEIRPSPSIWTWAWGTLPSKDEGTPTLPVNSSIIFSFCAHVLSDTSGKRILPRTPEELKGILAKYRLGTNRSRRDIIGNESFFNDKDVQSDFEFSEEWLMTFPKAIVDNPRLVIVIDDFILPGIIGFQILMMIYQSKTLNMDSQDVIITRPLTEDEIMTFLKEKCVIDNISLSFFPRWFGRKVSQWDETSNGSTSISIPILTHRNEVEGGSNEQDDIESHGVDDIENCKRKNSDDPDDSEFPQLKDRRWSSFVDLGGHLNFNLVKSTGTSYEDMRDDSCKDTDIGVTNNDEMYVDSKDDIDLPIWDERVNETDMSMSSGNGIHDESINVSDMDIENQGKEALVDNVEAYNDAPPENAVEVYDVEGDSFEETDVEELVSLEDDELGSLELEDISPEPARGDIYDSDTDSYNSLSLEDGENGQTGAVRKYRYRKSLLPTQEQLIALDLKDGENEIEFQLEGCVSLKSQLFVWSENAKIVVSDIEGAISVTKSLEGVLGFFASRNAVHEGVTQLLNNIKKNGYNILYIATKSLQQTTSTKDHLAKVGAGAENQLPPGPVFQSPESLLRAFGTERTDVFKASALRGVKALFPENHNPFYAGFGTRKSDLIVFSRCGLPVGRIYLVNERGEVKVSVNLTMSRKSFKDIDKDVDFMFPPVKAEKLNEDSFSDFNYWSRNNYFMQHVNAK